MAMRGPIEALGLVERFWLKANKGSPDECWLWSGRPSRYGYGELRFAGKTLKAHRVSFAIANGREATAGVCHHCDTRLCVNPAHLFDGDQLANMRDAVEKGRQAYGDGLATKLTSENVSDIRLRVANGELQATVARLYGVGQDHISRIVNRHCWARVQ